MTSIELIAQDLSTLWDAWLVAKMNKKNENKNKRKLTSKLFLHCTFWDFCRTILDTLLMSAGYCALLNCNINCKVVKCLLTFIIYIYFIIIHTQILVKELSIYFDLFGELNLNLKWSKWEIQSWNFDKGTLWLDWGDVNERNIQALLPVCLNLVLIAEEGWEIVYNFQRTF